MNDLRLNPETGRIAERLPEPAETSDGVKQWFTYTLHPDLFVQLLSDDEVGDWQPVEVVAR